MLLARKSAYSILAASLPECFALPMPAEAAADLACKPVFDANAKQKIIPTHIYLAMPEATEQTNGEAASVYATEDGSAGSKFTGQVWISKSRGLPLKMEGNMDVAGAPKTHFSARHEYTNVQAPSGVK